MQQVSSTLEARLATKERKPAVCIEFYAPDYVVPVGGFDPNDAIERFSIITLDWGGIDYRRELKSVPTSKKQMGKERNSTSLSFANLDRYLASLVVENNLESCWCVVRLGERDITDSSIVWFVGKLDKPGDVDQLAGSLTAKEALGSVTQQTPWRNYSPQCPLVPVYHVEGEDCVGFKEDGSGGRIPLTMAEKPAAYQAALTCPGSHAACLARENVQFFQGFYYQPITGSFLYFVTTQSRGFLGLFRRTRTRPVQDQYSNSDNTPYDTPVPGLLGRAQVEGVPIKFIDEGTSLVGWYAWTEGKLTAIQNIKNNTPGFPQPDFTPGTGGASFLGDYGGINGQDPVVHAGVTNEYYSRLAYSAAVIRGSANDVIDSPPVLSAVCVGEYPLPDDEGAFTLAGATDNPALLTRKFLTDHHALKHPPTLIDDAETLTTAAHCDGTLLDDSNGEVSPVPTALVPDAGTRFHRYLSTGVRDAIYYRRLIEGDTIVDWWEREADLVDEADVPALIAPVRYLRKRYTLNMLISEQVPALDLLYDTILPSFRGYLTTSATGRIQIKTERPADDCYLTADKLVGATTLAVDDVTQWKASLQGKVLIGAHLVTSEVREVILATYSSAGNSITLDRDATGTITLTASDTRLTGGSTTVQASGTLTVGGTPEAGAQIQAIIDGVEATYTLTGNDTTGSAAALLADTINADPTLNRIVVASWAVDDPDVITIKAKVGILTLDSPLAYAHDTAEECIRVLFVFNASNIKKGSFKWPGSGTQQYNRIEVNYRNASRDFAKETVRIDDKDNQALVNKTNTLKIDGAGIDNYHQAYRIGLAAAGKYFDGNKQASWETRDGLALLIEEGDVGCVTDSSSGLINYPVRAKSLNLNSNLSVSISADAYATSQYLDVVPETTIRIPSTLLGLPPSQTALRLFNSWPMRDADIALGGLSTPGFYAPAGLPSGSSAWPGAELWIDRGSGYTKLADIPNESIIGKAVFALPTATAGAWDMVHTVTVDLNRPGFTLPSGTLDRPVRIRLGTETLDYVTATQTSTTPNRWELSDGLLRGQARSEDQVDSHLTDEQFILIDESVPYILVEPQDVGIARDFKIIQRGTHPQTLEEVSAVSFTVEGLPIPPDIPSATLTLKAQQLALSWPAVDESVVRDFVSYVVYDGNNGDAEITRPHANKYLDPNLPTGTQVSTYTVSRKVKTVLRGNRISAGFAEATLTFNQFGAPRVGAKLPTAQNFVLDIKAAAGELEPLDRIKETQVEVRDADDTLLDTLIFPGFQQRVAFGLHYSIHPSTKFRARFVHVAPVILVSAWSSYFTFVPTALAAVDLNTTAPPTAPGQLAVSGATEDDPIEFIDFAATLNAYDEATLPDPAGSERLIRRTDDLRGLWYSDGESWKSITGFANVRDFGATGSGVTTTGSISSGSNLLTLDSLEDFKVGHYITIAGASDNEDYGYYLFARIESIAGSVATLDTDATDSVLHGEIAHNDTFAFRELVAAFGIGSYAAHIPRGHYNLSGPCDSSANSAIRLTQNTYGAGVSAYTAAFIGEVVGMTGDTDTADGPRGTTIDYTRLYGSGDYPAIFAAAGYASISDPSLFNVVRPIFRNLFFLARPDPSVTGLQLHNAIDSNVEACNFETTDGFDAPECTHPFGVPIVLSATNNNIWVWAKDVSILSGFWIGIVMSEATILSNVSITRCKIGLYAPELAFGGCRADRLVFGHCPTMIDVSAAGDYFLHIETLFSETWVNGTSGSTEWYGTTGTDIVTSSANQHVRIISYKNTVAGTGTIRTLTVSPSGVNVEAFDLTRTLKSQLFTNPLRAGTSTGGDLFLDNNADATAATSSASFQSLVSGTDIQDTHIQANAYHDRATGFKRIKAGQPAYDFYQSIASDKWGIGRAAPGAAGAVSFTDQIYGDSSGIHIVPPLFVSDTTLVTNLNAEKVGGQSLADLDARYTPAGGAVTSVFGRGGAVVAATNDYTFAQIDKTTSSLADLTTRSAGDLSSGTLLAARMPALTGDVTTSAGSVATAIGAGKVTFAMLATAAWDDDATLAANSSTKLATQHAVKTYVDNYITGLKFKQDVRVASTANVSVSSAPSSIDGVTLTSGDRVLLKNQTSGAENGVYVFNGASSALTRATDGDSATELISATFPVREGTTNQDTWWTVTNDSITLGTTALVFSQTGGAGTYTAGSGLSLSGNQFSVATGGVTNAMLAGSIAASKLVGSDIATVGTITSGTWSATAIGVTKGGTGLTTTTQGDILYADASNSIAKLAKNTTATRYLANTGTSNNPAWAQIDLSNGVTGTLPPANGGTGLATLTSNTIYKGNGTSAIAASKFFDNGTTGFYGATSDPNGGAPFVIVGPALVNGSTREILGLYDSTAMAAGVGGGFSFGGKYTSGGAYAGEFASLTGYKENGTDGDYAGALGFFTRANGGNPTLRVKISSAGNVQFTAYGAGTLTTDASGNITATSDERLKDIRGRFTVGLDALTRIEPILYQWNETSGYEIDHTYAGLSAQNIQSALGGYGVGVNQDGMLTVQDRAIIAVLINAVKELNEEVTQLKGSR